MKLFNCTPHQITIIASATITVPPSGVVARCSEKSSPSAVKVEVDGTEIQAVVMGYGAVENLPGPEEGTILIVSALVRAAVPDRCDVASPGALVRDDKGQPMGCRGLVFNH